MMTAVESRRGWLLEVANHLGLTYVPCGFQARIGGAKGFWIVDVRDTSGEIWIETYPSQRKWEEESNETIFDVVRWVTPLRVASLNLRLLPILETVGETT